MYCANVDPRVTAYVDGELDVVTDAVAIANIAQHINTCVECQAAVSEQRSLSASISREIPYHRASQTLHARMTALVASQATPSAPTAVPASSPTLKVDVPAVTPSLSFAKSSRNIRRWQITAIAASIMLAVVSAHDMMSTRRESVPRAASHSELISAHIRSLMSDHLLDVPSTDRHTVKPWFEGKIDFSPTVFDFAADSFPLTGGRLDYLYGRTVAALVFYRGQHPINLFVWPSDSADDAITSSEHDGYNSASWRRDHMQYAAVSSLNLNSLLHFAQLYATRDSVTNTAIPAR